MYNTVPTTTLKIEFLFHKYEPMTTAMAMISGIACGAEVKEISLRQYTIRSPMAVYGTVLPRYMM